MPKPPRTPEALVRLIAMELNGGEPRGNLKGQWNVVRARHILRALTAAGCVVVPREATEEMMVAAEDAVPALATFAEKEMSPSFIAYAAMIAANPLEAVRRGDG